MVLGALGFTTDVGINGENILVIRDLSDTASGAGRVIEANGLTASWPVPGVRKSPWWRKRRNGTGSHRPVDRHVLLP